MGLKKSGKIYVGAVTKIWRRFFTEEHLYADGWSLHPDQSLTPAQINEHNRPILEATFKQSGLPDIYKDIYVNDEYGYGI